MSALLAAGTIYLTYRAARHLTDRRTALLAAALVAFVPTRLTLSGAIGNENLAALAAAGALATLIAGATDRRRGFDTRRVATLALWTTIGIGSKITCLALLPAAAAVLFLTPTPRRPGNPISATPRADARSALARLAIVCLAVTLGVGWWFVRNKLLYGDLLRATAADRLNGGLQPGFDEIHAVYPNVTELSYLWTVLTWGWQSFWGRFDGTLRALPAPIYTVLLAVQAIAAAGFVRLWLQRRGTAWMRRRESAFAAMAVTATLVFLLYLRFNWQYLTPQGRYFFVLLVPFGICTAIGWHAVIPRRLRPILDTLLIAFLVGVNLYVVLTVPKSAVEWTTIPGPAGAAARAAR